MTWLLLDSSCPRAVVATCSPFTKGGRGILSTTYLTETQRHAEKLPAAIAECLTAASLQMTDLTGIAVGTGPGSFIGVRIAIAQAKGMATALSIPLLGLPTLDSFLSPFASHLGDKKGGRVLLITDARRNQFCVQEPGRPFQLVDDSEVLTLAQTHDTLIGYGHPAVTHPMPGPSAEGLLATLQTRLSTLSGREPESELLTLEPLYFREPDAKISGLSG